MKEKKKFNLLYSKVNKFCKTNNLPFIK
jgi:hypothetical protein